jgi:Ca-activated chloride channel homolog
MRCAVLPSLALVLLGGAVARSQPIEFPSSVEAVYVDVFVNHNGAPVAGLTGDNFELRDGGVRQKVSVVGHESLPLLAVLALDVSSSVTGEKADALHKGARAFMAGLRPSDRLVLLSFNKEVRRLADPREPGLAHSVLDGFTGAGTTSLYDALYVALRIPGRTERAVLVLFTDGEDNSSWFDERVVKRMAEESNVLIHVVGVVPIEARAWIMEEALATEQALATGARRAASSPEPEYVGRLKQIAEVTGGRFWTADSPSQLEQAFLAVLAAMKTRYILRYEPGTAPAPGFHRLEIKLRGAKGTVHARTGYFVASGKP